MCDDALLAPESSRRRIFRTVHFAIVRNELASKTFDIRFFEFYGDVN